MSPDLRYSVINFSKISEIVLFFLLLYRYTERKMQSAAQAHIETGICARNILQVANKTPYNTKGKTRSMAGGYIWVFESEVKK